MSAPDDAKPAAPADKPEKPAATAAPPQQLVDPTQVRLEKELKSARPPFGCRFDPAGRYIFSGSQNNLVERWDLATGQSTALAAHDSWVRAFAFSADGQTLWSGGYDGRVIAWPVAAEKPAPIHKLEAHAGWVRSLAMNPDGTLLASGGNDKLIKLWNPADGTALGELAGHEHHVYFVIFHPSEPVLVSGDLKGVIKLWDLDSRQEIRELSAAALWKYDTTFGADIGGTRGMSFSSDGKLLAVCGITNVSNAFAGIGSPLVVLFDWGSGKQLQSLALKTDAKAAAWSVRFHPGGFLIAAIGGRSNDGHLGFWKPDQPQAVHQLKLAGNARDLDLHADGLRIAVAQHNSMLGLYTMAPKA